MSGKNTPHTAVIGAGLAGCECAMALARAGIPCTLFEMKPLRFSPAHSNPDLAELVCSNSLRSNDPASAVGVLKNELRALGSLTMLAADGTGVPAGKALAVDRARFSARITSLIEAEPLIRLERREILSLEHFDFGALRQDAAGVPGGVLAVCAGPLAGEALSRSLLRLLGGESLYFYDAIAPIVEGESLNREIIFPGSRYDRGEGDYLNCPMNREEYMTFYHALLEAEKTPTRDFEKIIHFEGCMPVEALAERGERTLTFGPFKPVGLIDPRSGRRPFALLQLRAENLNRSMFNLVGCQTKLAQREQERVFRLIPGLEQARFARYGSMHRNTFVNAPRVLNPDLSLRAAPHIFLAGQITGVEGYVESAACGLWLGLLLAARAHGRDLPPPPPQSALGALLLHLRSTTDNFQPSNIQYGLMPALEVRAGKADRKALYARRAELAFKAWMNAPGAPSAATLPAGVEDA